MKKLLLVCTAIFAVNFAANAQIEGPITDTLRYFSNKQYYILPADTLHPYYKSLPSLTTNTTISHVGSIFHNVDTIVISGAETYVERPPLAASYQNGVPFRMYLCNVSASGLPIWPPIDSTAKGYAQGTLTRQFGQEVLVPFTSTRTVTGDFAILLRNISSNAADSVFLFRTAGYAPTANNAPSPANKFGEGLGVLRDNGVFHKTTGYTARPGFGVGTDFEFCIAPIVTYTFTTREIESPIQAGACCFQVFTNTNTTNGLVGNTQFNFNEFYRVWKPSSAAFPNTFVPDSVFTWVVGDSTAPYYTVHGDNTVDLSFQKNHCNKFYQGTFISLLKTSRPSSPTYSSGITFTSSTVWCGNDTAGTGIPKIGALANLKIYPNPTNDKTTISGLEGNNTILVYDMVGQLVSTQVTDKEIVLVDLLKQPRGNYVLRITNTQSGSSRVVKILKE